MVAGWSGGGGKEGIVKIVFLARYTCCSSATDHREGCQNMDSEQQPTEQLSVVPEILKCSIAYPEVLKCSIVCDVSAAAGERGWSTLKNSFKNNFKGAFKGHFSGASPSFETRLKPRPVSGLDCLILCRIRSTSVISSRNTHSLSTLSKELCYTEQSS